jgi:hypothetical protein
VGVDGQMASEDVRRRLRLLLPPLTLANVPDEPRRLVRSVILPLRHRRWRPTASRPVWVSVRLLSCVLSRL